MANRWAVANGNWSNTATWNGGTLPTAADDVFANNFTVTIDQNVTSLSLRTEAAAGINAGGGFTLAAAYNITADLYAGTSNCVTYSSNSPTAVTITGNLYSSSTTNNTRTLNITGTGSCTVNGNCSSGLGASASGRRTIFLAAAATLVVNGNLSASGASSEAVYITIAGVNVTVNGNLTAGAGGSGTSICLGSGGGYTSGSVTITGSLNASTVASGGSVLWINGQNLTVNNDQTIPANATASLISFQSPVSNSTCTINGNITSNCTTNVTAISSGAASSIFTMIGNCVSNSDGAVLSLSGSNSVNTITGNVVRNGSRAPVSFTGTGSALTVNGNISATFSFATNVISIAGTNQTFTVNGNVLHCLGGTGGVGGHGTLSFAATNVTATINGNVIGAPTPVSSASHCIILSGTGSLTINGTVTAGDLANTTAIFAQGVSPFTLIIRRVVGNGFGAGITNRGEAHAVSNVGSPTQLIVKEFEFGPAGAVPVRGYCQIVGTTDRIALFRNSSGTQITLVDPATLVTPPAVTDVRSGVVYNNGNLTGTLAVPPVNQVAAGIAVDNTVGTAALTQASVWDYALSSASSVAGSVGEKLKKTAIPADIIALG